jgi:hypothetical protein
MITNKTLIKKAASIINPRKVGEYLVGDVGCALVVVALWEMSGIHPRYAIGIQIDPARPPDNIDAEVILDLDKTVRLAELLPYPGWFQKTTLSAP